MCRIREKENLIVLPVDGNVANPSTGDFVLASPPPLSENTDSAMRLMLSLLRWQFDESGPKADVFASEVCDLGVVFSLDDGTSLGTFTVSNTERRLAEICTMIDDIIASGTLTAAEKRKKDPVVQFLYARHLPISAAHDKPNATGLAQRWSPTAGSFGQGPRRLGPTPSFEGTLKGYLKGTLKVPLKVLSPHPPPPPHEGPKP